MMLQVPRRGRAGSARRDNPENATELDGPRFARGCVARRSRATYSLEYLPGSLTYRIILGAMSG